MVFNPETPFVNEDFTGRSKGRIANKGAAVVGAGLGAALAGGVKAVEEHTENKIRSEITGARDQLFDEFGVAGMIDSAGGPDLPSAVKATQDQFSVLQAQLDQGAISPTQFYTRAGALASQVRAKYPNWRPEIDQMTKSIFGFDPANKVANEMFKAQAAGQASQDWFFRDILSDIDTESAKKIIGQNDNLKFLRDKFLETQDIEIGRKLQRELLTEYGEQGRIEKELEELNLRVKEQGAIKENTTGFVTESLSTLRQKAMNNGIARAFNSQGIEGTSASLFSYLQEAQKNGLDKTEIEAFVTLIGDVKNNYQVLVDDLGSQRVTDVDGVEKTVRQVLGADFNTLVNAEIAQLDRIINDVRGGNIDVGLLVMDSVVEKLMKDQEFADYREEMGDFGRKLQFMRETYGEQFVDLLTSAGVLGGTDGKAVKSKFLEFLLIESGRVADGDTDTNLADPTKKIFKLKGGGQAKGSALKSFYTAIKDLASGKGTPEHAAAALQTITSTRPEDLFSVLDEYDTSRVQVLSTVAHPDVTRYAAENFKGTAVWENYKTFVTDSFGMVPNIRNATNEFRSDYEQNRDRLEFTFDENTFSFSVDLKDPADAVDLSRVLRRQRRYLETLNRYFAILEPIHEAEGVDAAQFLSDTFDKLRLDKDVLPMVEDLQSSLQGLLGGDDEEISVQMSTHSPANEGVGREIINLADGDRSTLEALPEAIADIITVPEGTSGPNGYDTILGHAQGKFGITPTDMTLDEVISFQSKRGKGSFAEFSKKLVGRIATPMGRYQIVGKTLRGLKKELELTGEEKFDEELQDTLFQALLDRRGFQDYQAGTIDEIDFISRLSKEWAGVKISRDARRALMEIL